VRPLRLRYLTGPRRGDELIFSGPRVRIGRSRDNTLILTESDAPASSGRHAEALRDRGGWWIADVGSTNGTYVNDARIERRRLRAGDRIAFGDDQFLVAGSRQIPWLAAAVVVLIAVVAVAAYATRRHTPVSYERIASTAARSVYAVAIDDNSRRTIVATAFAVDSAGILATNAHVAHMLREQGAIDEHGAAPGEPDGAPASLDGAQAFHASAGRVRALAIRGDTYEVIHIVGATAHPDWKPGSLRADAGILRLERGATVAPLPLADDEAFTRLQRGMALVSFGFPAASTDPQQPRGRVSVDVVGDVRGEYVQAGLAIAPGTSGSPVFGDEGSVVAMVAGGDFVNGADGRLMPSGSQANWAISVERIRELLRQGGR
jgi:hypothetical protein